jgi:chaperone required for assembly of F1-ATPase
LKRIYKTVAVVEGDEGFSVTLDDRPVRSPARRDLTIPNRALAKAVAAEWDAQLETVEPREMPMMSLLATATDRVGTQRDHVISTIAGYAESDLLCYRAEQPLDLVQRQIETWQPLLDWCADSFNARLRVATGIMPVRQNPEALKAFRDIVAGYEDLPMTALHELTAISGSIVVGLAVAEGRIAAEDGVAVAQLDEVFQLERNGEEEEAMERLANMRADLLAAAAFLKLCRAWN